MHLRLEPNAAVRVLPCCTFLIVQEACNTSSVNKTKTGAHLQVLLLIERHSPAMMRVLLIHSSGYWRPGGLVHQCTWRWSPTISRGEPGRRLASCLGLLGKSTS